jgi:hypothetical protein
MHDWYLLEGEVSTGEAVVVLDAERHHLELGRAPRGWHLRGEFLTARTLDALNCGLLTFFIALYCHLTKLIQTSAKD